MDVAECATFVEDRILLENIAFEHCFTLIICITALTALKEYCSCITISPIKEGQIFVRDQVIDELVLFDVHDTSIFQKYGTC